jgi:hypothetical protein
MEGILAKTGNDYILYSKDNNVLGITSGTIEGRKLSLHNCEDIERGYDLENLSRERLSTRFDENSGYHKFVFVEAYKEGFLKAMEILGDKKFSVKDMEKLMFATIEFTEQKEGETYPFLKSFIQSLQPKEWDVEIQMENKQQLTNGYKNQPDNVIGFITAYENVVVPKLDSDGCLILRRI